jgi:hypothetical protein
MKIKNIAELRKSLEKMDVKKTWYSICENYQGDTYVVTFENNCWMFFYFDEKGNKENIRMFDNESDACSFFYETIVKELKTPTSKPFW